MKFLKILVFLCTSQLINAQTNDVLNSKKTTTIGAFLDIYVIDLYDGLDVGSTISYTRDFYSKGKHYFAYNPSLGFFNSIDTENRYILGLGAQYRFEPTKRSNIRVNLGVNYILTKFLYDRFEYNAQNEPVEQKNLKSNFGPSIGLQYSYDVFRIKSVSIAPVLGYKLIKLDGGKYSRITEGFSPSFSLGIICKF
ncbi:hypothetical protein [Maribacter sp.]|uniref:hypothetical protein n=1 Tax=Maribacter sp. TaxID=1897614 RepID=UPI0025BAAA64|nr:hypothetical protein [Maribacter sp.]